MAPQPISELASKLAKDRQDLVRKAREYLEQAQERQKKYYDSKRTSLTFKVGDLFLLDAKNLTLKKVNAHIKLKKAKHVWRSENLKFGKSVDHTLRS